MFESLNQIDIPWENGNMLFSFHDGPQAPCLCLATFCLLWSLQPLKPLETNMHHNPCDSDRLRDWHLGIPAWRLRQRCGSERTRQYLQPGRHGMKLLSNRTFQEKHYLLNSFDIHWQVSTFERWPAALLTWTKKNVCTKKNVWTKQSPQNYMPSCGL